MNKLLDYFYNSWIQTAGPGWTGKQVFISYLFSILFAALIVLYSFIAGLHWTWIQILSAALIAWDLSGGALGYNHSAIKKRHALEKGNLHFFHHNLQHIHPLILIFFNNGPVLLGITIYWFITFMLYVEYMEIDPETRKRKISGKGEKAVIIFEILAAVIIVLLSFLAPDIRFDYMLYGTIVYFSLPVFTLILINIPIPFQRTTAVLLTVFMIAAGMYLPVPLGFGWLIPVYFLKLLVGFTAKDDVA